MPEHRIADFFSSFASGPVEEDRQRVGDAERTPQQVLVLALAFLQFGIHLGNQSGNEN